MSIDIRMRIDVHRHACTHMPIEHTHTRVHMHGHMHIDRSTDLSTVMSTVTLCEIIIVICTRKCTLWRQTHTCMDEHTQACTHACDTFRSSFCKQVHTHVHTHIACTLEPCMHPVCALKCTQGCIQPCLRYIHRPYQSCTDMCTACFSTHVIDMCIGTHCRAYSRV